MFLSTGAGSSTLLLLLGVDYETTYSAPEDPLDCDFDLNIPDDNCRPTTPIHGMVPAYCCYCIAKESATAATGFDRWAKHTRSRGGTNNMPPYTYGELFKRFMNLCLSEDRLDQRTRPTPQRLPRHWADSVDKNNTMAAINVGSWLRTCLPRGMHTLEPPFHKVYPRLSDPPLDN